MCINFCVFPKKIRNDNFISYFNHKVMFSDYSQAEI